MVTQAEIARLVQLDRTSVSKILCGSQSEHFSEEAAKRVKDAAAQLGYRHRNFKNALNIGFVFPAEDNAVERYFCAERTIAALLGISRVISDSKHRLQIINVDYARESFDFERMAGSADVFVIWELTWPWTKPFYDLLDKKHKDYVVINRVEKDFPGSYIVHESDENYIRAAVRTFREMGHTKIAGVFNQLEMGCRGQAMREAFADAGLEFSMDSVLRFHERDAAGCSAAAQTIVDKGFSAVFAQGNDMSALDLIIELNKLGVKVPEDVSVLGNHKKKSMPSLGMDLSSFSTPWFEMGKLAAAALIARAATGCHDTAPTQTVLAQTFYEGNTIRRLSR